MEQANLKIEDNVQKYEGKKSRKFFITFWEKTDLLKGDKILYSCQCFDQCSEEHGGKFHGHAYIYFENPRTWSLIKKHYGKTCHVDIPFKNSWAINYIMNPEHEHGKSKYDRVEQGQRPMDNGEKKTVKEALNLTEDEILNLSTKEAVHILRIRKELECEDINVEDFEKEIKVYWIQGPSGCGKTKKAKQIIRENGGIFSNAKYEHGFWSGVKNHKTKVMLYDDFRAQTMTPWEFIQLTDYHVHPLNIKGGNIQNDYNLIIITSIQKLKNIYKDFKEEDRIQWLRRIEVIDMYENEVSDSEECIV